MHMKKTFASLSILATVVVVISTLFKINLWQNADILSRIGLYAMPVLIVGVSGYLVCRLNEKLAPAKQRRK